MKTHTLIHHFLEYSADLFPNKAALVFEKKRVTYNQINSQANQLASFLVNRGVKKHDRIVIIFYNSIEYVVAYYGSLKAGCAVVPLNTELKSETLKNILKELDPRMIITDSKFSLLIKESKCSSYGIKEIICTSPSEIWNDTPYSVYPWGQIIEENLNCHNLHIPIGDRDLASIIYTSGSTSLPKGVMLTHKNIIHNTRSICQYLELTEKDIQMVVLPFYYVMGKSLLNTHFAVGGRVVINNEFAFPATVINQMIDEKVTGFSGVPSTFAYLLHRSPLGKHRDKLTSLRYCSQAGGHMSKQIKMELQEVLPKHTKIVIMYGATEASARLSYVPPERFNDKIESIGIPIPGVTLKVLDKEGKELSSGEIGEIVANGSNIMQGYWKDLKMTSIALDENGYRTGDMAYKDDEGYFYVIGRKDNQLKVGGHRINTQEIEDIILSTGHLVEVTVIGIPDKLSGNKLVALIVPKVKEFQIDTLYKECSLLLPKYKLPSRMKIINSLPKKDSGKIDRSQCFSLLK